MKYPLIEIILLISILGLIVYTIFRFRKNRKINMLNATLSVEELELHAKRAALTHTVTFKKNILSWPLTRVNENYGFIKSLYKDLNDDIRQKRAVPPAAEWILDNYYVIEEQTQSLRRDLNKKDYFNLPILNKGPFRGYTRVLAISMEFVAIVDGQIDETTLLKYLEAYQSHSILLDREIRAIPMMLKIALLENVRLICENIKETQKQWNLADGIVDKWWSEDVMNDEKIISLFKSTLESKVEAKTPFVEHLFYRFRRSGRSYVNVLRNIDEHLVQFDTTTEAIAQKEHNAQAVSAVSMGNDIMSFKYVASLNWAELFEALSFVERILRQDPDDVYSNMDSNSRGYYLMRTEKLAKVYGVSERHIAQVAINLAKEAAKINEDLLHIGNEHIRRAHVGFYLVGEGTIKLGKNQKNKDKIYREISGKLTRHQGKIYIGMIILMTTLLVGTAVSYCLNQINSFEWLYGLLVGAVTLIPASEVGISLVNWSVGKIKKPAFFARLELKEGIPDSLSTMVVVPTLLSNENRVAELLKNIENHYLANKEENLYFALIGGFKDSSCASTLEDNPILKKAQEGINQLNRRYADGSTDIFYFFHRKNMFNEIDQSWTGWERKRGALMEFNDLLLGDKNTSFIRHENNRLIHADIKYIITLDADTVLPLGMAKKMIGTMAHPCNLPVIDEKRKVVIEGHGLMQPRISFDMDSSNKSVFSRIYTGQEGMDPYANAISDVYQDLFDEGIFTGKGIYDLRVFRDVLKDVVPENAVLSHDLLEGSYLRAALVSDLELVDSYPTKYNAYMARLHRWIRGDWQLIPWLSRTVKNKRKEIIANPLSYISIWKIADNLRRSLVGPSLMLLIVLAISMLPGNVFFWLGCAALVILLPLFINIIEEIASNGLKLRASKRHITGFFGFKASLFQLLLTSVFLPYQTIMILNAIIVTLIRVLITKKKMLEWVTSDDAEKMQSSSLKSYVSSMGVSSLFGIPIVALALIFKPENLRVSLIFVVIWGIAPFIAYFISKGKDTYKEVLNEEELLELRYIARKTWRYFEEFANKKNNYLAPDNYQEEPYKGIAYRTSPTNIGLGLLATITARDLGYISIEETLSQLENTMGTIDKLEKWNGHLYNWYDTRTLEPLKPRYISTVDSGNLVCYLMTLRQGLKEYCSSPIIDSIFLKGIEDTYACASENSSSFFEDEDILRMEINAEKFSLIGWKRTLEKAIINPKIKDVKKETWKYKLEQMAGENLKELLNFMPWVGLIEEVPNQLYSDEIKDITTEWITMLDKASSMKNYNEYCIEIRKQGELIIEMIEKNKETNSAELIDWVNEVLLKVEKGQVYMMSFKSRYENMIERIYQMTEETRFAPLYEKKRQLFSIGFNFEDNRLSNSYYDLLASEARQTSYIAIARGEVPAKHWYMLGRSLTVVDQYKGLVSWSGTMFEYLMPLILMKNYSNTLLDETYSFVIKSQKKYGKERHMPWGASESAFSSMDMHLDYQYKAIGVPWLGLKRGLIEDAVTAPYATFLALLVNPIDAYKNIQYLKKEGLEGEYGYYEAADYTPERLSVDQEKIIIKSYMAHHQGMSLLSLNNYLNRNIMQIRFSADPYVKAARLLLQEKVPTNIVYTKESKEKIIPFKGTQYHDKGSYRHFFEPNDYLPKAHVLSNGYYSVVTTDKGTGYSRTKDYAITRWREDSILDSYGMFFYIKNKETGENWSAAYAPLNILPEGYEVVFTADKTMIKRVNGQVDTLTEIIVTSGENAEIRRIKLKNNGEKSCDLELTSYYEVVMAEQKSDESHQAFSKLFVETEFNQEYNALLAHRRPRSDTDKDLWVAHMAIIDGEQIGDIQYETDRMQFIGRGHNVSNPVAIERERPLSNSVGNVLDPVFSLRVKVNLSPGRSARISFVTMTANSKEQILELLSKYNSIETCDAAFWLAVIRSEVETKYLNIKAREMELYQNMISGIIFLSPLRQKHAELIKENHKGQSALWSYGISGDRPIVFVKIQKSDDVAILYELLKAHEYWRIKDLRVDLVILVMEEYSYTNPLLALVTDIVRYNQETDMMHKKGDIFILNLSMIDIADMYLLSAVARMCFNGQKGTISEQLQQLPLEELEAAIIPDNSIIESDLKNKLEQNNEDKSRMLEEKLRFFNGVGGFSSDNESYVVSLEEGQTTPLPWSNIIANEEFGFTVTESGCGYTWCHNSRENKLTPWSNDPVSDSPGEVFYFCDEAVNIWSMTALPIREKGSYHIEHGFGFTSFKHTSHGIAQSLTQFVPLKGNVKISLISLKNEGKVERNLALTYFIEPVLGVSRAESAMHLISGVTEEGILTVKNSYNQVFTNQTLFIDTSVTERSYSGNRKVFFGTGNMELPEELTKIKLSGKVGAGYDPCATMQVKVSIPPEETIQLVFIMGIADNKADIIAEGQSYKTVEGANAALQAVKTFWKEKFDILQVSTPDLAMNQMMNGRLLYQIIACRLWARTAFYQAGGAYGFRDQLQDSLSLLAVWPELTRAQIIKHAAHQFVEGDVLHWWHEPALKGTRTRISDDFLWLPFVVAQYVSVTADNVILEEDIQFLDSDLLKDYEDERYLSPNRAEEGGSLYEHCIRAIENGLRFGEHGLPLMGCGDWNDGMNKVGNEGKGESVWLAWFLVNILKKWIPICLANNDSERVEKYKLLSEELVIAIENHGWDGNWYKRAYFDDGTQLGSSNNSECKIDSLAQTWAVLSEAGNPDRAIIAMTALEDYLVSRNDGIIRLLTPPFDNGTLEPGYIKGYVPGVRENGGQYTHAAAWVVAAFAKLGHGDKAVELFEMINPINHARTNIELGIYKAEPYVMAADVYGCRPHIGRGGWSWYTGAAGWMYQAGINSILGFNKLGDELIIDPCIPKRWNQFSISYTFEQTIYDIQVSNPEGISQGTVRIKVNGIEQMDNKVHLVGGQYIQVVEVLMKAI